MRKPRFLIALALLLAALSVAAYLLRAPLALAVAGRIAVQRLAADAVRDLPDGLHVGVCGAGSPFTDDTRSGPCTLVIAGRRMFVFDAGSGSSRTIGKMGFNQGRIDAVFLTHFHSDHIDGLGELMLQRWVSVGNTAPVPVYGPPGVDAVLAGLQQAYDPDRQYRVAHHGAATVPPGGFGAQPLPFTPGPDGRVVVLQDAGLEIAAFVVDHAPVHPAVGYRISYKGRSVVLSGDTRQAGAVQREAARADLLVHEALSAPLVAVLRKAAAQAGRNNLVKIFDDILDYHSSPEQAAQTARDAGARYLLLNHITPLLALPGLEKVFLGRAPDIFDGPIRVAADGDFISLPAGSTAIDLSHRF